MFTFSLLELAIILLGWIVMIFGLTFFALRRRDEILQDFLVPNDTNIDQEFFRAHNVPEAAPEVKEESVHETATHTPEDTGWGAPLDIENQEE
ncbi:MAG: hypothetical protein ACRCUY_02345 [Thermoguttaceae bacterium]